MDGVKRFTTEYVPEEDRIRLSVEDSEGQVFLLWLTRRLCVRLIPQLVKLIASLPKLRGGDAGALQDDTMQRHQQLAALGKLENHDPVQGSGEAISYLVTSMSLRLNRKAILLDFKVGPDGTVHTIPFPEASLRQWLVMLNAMFKRAAWQDDVWPGWINLKTGTDKPDAIRLN